MEQQSATSQIDTMVLPSEIELDWFARLERWATTHDHEERQRTQTESSERRNADNNPPLEAQRDVDETNLPMEAKDAGSAAAASASAGGGRANQHESKILTIIAMMLAETNAAEDEDVDDSAAAAMFSDGARGETTLGECVGFPDELSPAAAGLVVAATINSADTVGGGGQMICDVDAGSFKPSDHTSSTDAISQCQSFPEEADNFSVPSAISVTSSLIHSTDKDCISDELIGLTHTVEAQFETEISAIQSLLSAPVSETVQMEQAHDTEEGELKDLSLTGEQLFSAEDLGDGITVMCGTAPDISAVTTPLCLEESASGGKVTTDIGRDLAAEVTAMDVFATDATTGHACAIGSGSCMRFGTSLQWTKLCSLVTSTLLLLACLDMRMKPHHARANTLSRACCSKMAEPVSLPISFGMGESIHAVELSTPNPWEDRSYDLTTYMAGILKSTPPFMLSQMIEQRTVKTAATTSIPKRVRADLS